MKTLIKLVNTPVVLDSDTVKKIQWIGTVIIVVASICLLAFGNINGLSNTYLG